MNIANRLTLLRVFLSFLCVGLILKNTLVSLILALLLFILASSTDFLDGYIARKKKIVSDLGKLLDPIADKILTIGVFCAFLQLQVINAWIVILIMVREFTITGIRLFALNKGIVLEARRIGKHKTFSQLLGIFLIFFALIGHKKFPTSYLFAFLYYLFVPLVMWYIVIVTLLSGIYYLWLNRNIIKTF
ncbi:MAG: CDP-diacylglycerol--glycerol-3-phosphate 3-phosphatidyltransferase [Candidatus Omnitrophica bacterium 4484_70.1]|nr:MAG: CDP-diacylglycerol--glycerol-3-phosphate 3-phosphatidyltransferase [Candidatus Omnitrophica bacterium 4484_70.1]